MVNRTDHSRGCRRVNRASGDYDDDVHYRALLQPGFKGVLESFFVCLGRRDAVAHVHASLYGFMGEMNARSLSLCGVQHVMMGPPEG